MKLFIIAIAWALGLLLGFLWPAAVFWLLPFLVVPFVLLAMCRRNPGLLFYAFYLLAFLLGMFRPQFMERTADADSIAFYQGDQQVSLKGVVDSEASGKGRVARFELAGIRIKSDGEWKEVKGRALVETWSREHEYGDLLYLKGTLKPLSGAGSYYRYLEKQGVSSWMSFPQISSLGSNRGSWLNQRIRNLRLKLARSLSSYLPEPQGALAQAVLLGLRQEIPEDLNRDFSNTGTTHLLAISGMNISVFAGMVMSLGLWVFGRRHYVYLAFAFLLVWLYTFLSGMNPPVMRAAFMASAYFLGEVLGRPRSGAPMVALSAIIMTAIHPQALWDVSFQLSFTAMLGLTFIAPLFMKVKEYVWSTSVGVSNMPGFLQASWDMASVSAGAILATLPLTAYYFGVIPMAGLPATMLASLTLPYVIVVSSMTSLAGLVFAPLAQLLGWIDWIFLTGMILAVKAFSFWPHISITEGYLPLSLIISYYVVLVASAWCFATRENTWELLSNLRRRLNIFFRTLPVPGPGTIKALLLGLLLANVLIWAAVFTFPDRFTHVHFIDVGHGDSVYVQTPNGHQILIDGGSGLYQSRLYLGKKMPFWDRRLDMVAVSHPHEDHLGGLPQVLLKYDVDYVLDSRLPVGISSYDRWRKQVGLEGAIDIIARDDVAIDLGNNTLLEVLHPSQELDGKAAMDIDNNALVLLLTVGKVRFLLPSDNRDKGQRETLLEHPDLGAAVLAAPHHGGESLDPLFVSASRPASVVISANYKDRTSSEKAISRFRERFPGASLFTTFENGSIEFITDGEKLWVRTER